jgi:hypothetical protein
MPVPLDCECGRSLRVKDELAGRRIRCPGCSDVLTVPKPETSHDADEEATALLLSDEPSEAAAPRARYRDEPSESDAIQRRPSPRPSRPTASRAPAPPNVRRAKSRGGPRVAFEQGWFGSMNAGVIGGLLMMLIAVVWFAVGLAVGIIFFYPPILLVLGFIAMVKGLMGGR